MQVAIDGDLDAARGMVKAGLLLYIGGMGSKKTNFYADLTRRFGFAEVADEVQSLYLDGKREEAYAAIPDELVDATAMIGTEDEVAERVKRFADAGVDRMIVSPMHGNAEQNLAHAREARRHGRRGLARLIRRVRSRAVDVIREQYAATNERDFAHVMDLYADDVVLRRTASEGVQNPGTYEGKEAVGEWFGDWFRTFAHDYRFEIAGDPRARRRPHLHGRDPRGHRAAQRSRGHAPERLSLPRARREDRRGWLLRNARTRPSRRPRYRSGPEPKPTRLPRP